MMPRALRLRLLLAGSVSILLALVIAAVGLTAIFKHHVARRIDAELMVYLNQLGAGLDRQSPATLTLAKPPSDPRFDAPLSGLYWQVRSESDGEVLRSRSLWDFELELPKEGATEATIHHHSIKGPKGELLYLLQRRVALPPRLGGGTAVTAVAIETAEVDLAVQDFAGALVPLLSLTALVLLAANWIQVGIGLKPLSTVRRDLSAIKSGTRTRLGNNFPPEIQPLAHEVDALLDARDVELARAKTRAADLAHGLRTPLQVLTTEVEALVKAGQPEIAFQIATVTKGMQQTIEREIAKARLAAKSKDAATCNVLTVVNEIVRVVERTPIGQTLDWIVTVPDDMTAPIDRDDLAECLGNLIENAARHARSGIAVSGRSTAEHIEISIRDDGPGIPETMIPRVLERGGRLDERGSGAGLGLAIAQETLAHWNGTLTLENTGPGLAVLVRLPKSSR